MAYGTKLVQEKILNSMPKHTGISLYKLQEQTQIQYHTLRRYILSLIEEGKVTEFGKDGKTTLYAVNEYTKHNCIPKFRKLTGELDTIESFSAIVESLGRSPQTKTIKETFTFYHIMASLCHEIMKANEGQEIAEEKIFQTKMFLVRFLDLLEKFTQSVRSLIQNESIWNYIEWDKFQQDPDYKRFSNTTKLAWNILQGKEIYPQEMLFSQITEDESLLG